MLPKIGLLSPTRAPIGYIVLTIEKPGGVFDAIVRAVEVTDDCVRQVVEAGRSKGYCFVITADHGNADKARNADGTANTAHSTNPVPIIVLDDRSWRLRSGILADIAPTVLELMGMEKPAEMTGSSLLVAVPS